ncbi:MAG: hypothetical protein RL459_612 [Pseudomonadota bacterium]|jgi:hypothetical protein
MAFWQLFKDFAVSSEGETINRISDDMSVSSRGVVYTRMGDNTVGSDGSLFTSLGQASSDGSLRIGNTATGLGAVFNDDDES